ncbi:MAG: VOC family protein [Gammaproteobacteria bacterium]|nr:VOC family protein [Gammaproteobacteria bacterium]
MQRCFTNVLSEDVDNTALFYQNLLGMTRHFDSDWFVILTHPEVPGLELGVLQRAHAIVPASIANAPAGIIVTFVVDDCDEVYKRAKSLSTEVLQAPTDLFYGQRRMLLKDPDGTVIDVSSPNAPVDS